MLRRTPSLARRAALVFATVYAAILFAVLALNAASGWADRGPGNLRGPRLAIDYASDELQKVKGQWRLSTDGRLAELADRNPSLWLVVVEDGRLFASGPLPARAAATVGQLKTIIDVSMFRLPGDDTPLGVVSLQRRELASGSVLLAVGGVDPATLSTGESISELLNPSIVVMLAVIAVISALAMFFAVPSFARALGPITTEAGAIGPFEPGRRLEEAKAPKELLPLVRAFNAALERLELELGRRKRFIADVAHELRTPLAVVSLRADALMQEEGRDDLRRGLKGLTHLVSQMLDLERLSLLSGKRTSVDLIALARNVVADLAPMAIAQGYDLSLTAPELPVTVTGDPHAMERALSNLVGNAIVHGGNTGHIAVTVGANRTVDVADEGPGVTPDLNSRLFEPFVRGNAEAEGCGLGLHIARAILRAQGGDATFVPGGPGARFRLSFRPHNKAFKDRHRPADGQ